MLVEVPPAGVSPPEEVFQADTRVRPATVTDVADLVKLDARLTGLQREPDLRMFVENALGCWHLSVAERGGECVGFMASIRQPASRMVGPGVAVTEEIAIRLVASELCQHAGGQALVLVPCTATRLARAVYSWGGRNCEVHIAQVRGAFRESQGLVLPTFMPESG